MTDNSFQDVVSGSGRSIRRIPVSRKAKTQRPDSSGGGVLGRMGGSDRPPMPHRKKASRFGMWSVALLSIIILYFVFSVLFSGVKVQVTPKQEVITIDGDFTAFSKPQSGELSFEVMTLTRELSDEVSATGEEFVEEKASGKIIIYNDYSSASQKLIDNTRFETPEGLIYRIKNAVVVPGRQKVDGETVPGSLEVMVYADKPGEAYNKELVDFTIPGLKGDPRYSKFYARSKSVLEGGFSGTIRSASAEDLAVVSSKLDEKLRAEILKEAFSVKPEGFLLFDGAYNIDIKSRTSNGEDGNVLVTQEATLHGLIFDEEEFAQFVAENTIASYDGAPVLLADSDDLSIVVDNFTSLDITNAESVDFRLNGNTKVVWVFDKEALLEELKGQSKRDTSAIFARYPGISNAEVVIRPFWKRSVTDKEAKIRLETIVK